MQTMTPEGIREAFNHLRDGRQMAGLADAARCRSESDWLIGINGTRALTKRMFGSRAGNVASVGRVQTPTLAIVYARELEIRNFKPRAYWRVTATFSIAKGSYEGVYQRANFTQGRERRARPHRPDLGEGAAPRRCSRPARASPGRAGLRGKEGEHPGFPAPLRPDDAAAGGQQPVRALRRDGRSRSLRPCMSGTR